MSCDACVHRYTCTCTCIRVHVHVFYVVCVQVKPYYIVQADYDDDFEEILSEESGDDVIKRRDDAVESPVAIEDLQDVVKVEGEGKEGGRDGCM